MDTITLVINIIIHMLILFIFLSVFFFVFISKKEQEALNGEIDKLSNRVSNILSVIDEQDKNKKIDWQIVKEKSEKEMNYDDLDIEEYISSNNQNLKYISIAIVLSLLLLVISIYIYYKYLLNKDIDISYIIYENITIFICIGLIEFLFFTYIASKYIPIFPVEISNTILERIKSNIMNST